MRSYIALKGLRPLFWYFNKNMRSGIQGLFVDMNSVKMVKNLIQSNKKIVIMPLYKSFADFFVQIYVQMTQHLYGGFTFGNMDDTPRIALMDTWLRHCGYILQRRKGSQSLQSNYVNCQMMKEVISSNQVTTVYQNGMRFRTGKLCRRLHAELSVRWLLETYAWMQ